MQLIHYNLDSSSVSKVIWVGRVSLSLKRPLGETLPEGAILDSKLYMGKVI